jgi:integrase/recombinase XerD
MRVPALGHGVAASRGAVGPPARRHSDLAMSARTRLTSWDQAVASYLAHRRAFGRVYRHEGWMLGQMRRFLVAIRAADLDQGSFERWRRSIRHLHANTRRNRENAAFKFCRYRRRSEPDRFLPNPLSFTQTRPHQPPVLLEPQQIAKLLATASAWQSRWRSSTYGAVMRMAIVLAYTAGLRRAELARLQLGDVDLEAGTLHIRSSKFHKSRRLPLSLSACEELRRYMKLWRTRLDGRQLSAPLLFHGCARPRGYTTESMGHAIRQVIVAADIRDHDGRRPRVHDMRHSFAAAALLRWYETDADVQVNLPKLALYMGHVSIVSTAYYLRCLPAVVARASERFERTYASLIEERSP